jgi:protein-S-isoprenylcysteine O-methyltransferase Ste14
MIAAGFLLDSFWTLPLALLPYQNLAGIAVVVLGLGLSARSVIEFVRHGTHPDPHRPTTTIIRSGPFRWSRNPIYLAFAIVHLGLGVWFAKTWVVLTLPLAVAIIRYGVIAPEERYLGQKFGAEYENYLTAVRRWL